MNTSKRNARLAGFLILLATATFITGDGLLASIFGNADFLAEVYPNRSQIIIGVMLEYVDAFAVVGVGILLYPLLQPHDGTIAIGYVATRILEAVLLLVSGVSLLALIVLSQNATQSVVADTDIFHVFGTLLIEHSNLSFQLAMLALGIGSVPFCYLLFTSKLIPQWMALTGIVGYIALAASAVLTIFGNSNLADYLYIPGAIFEIVFPLWLLFRGLDTSNTVNHVD